MPSPLNVVSALEIASTHEADDALAAPAWSYLRSISLSEVLRGYVELRWVKYDGYRNNLNEPVLKVVETLVREQDDADIIRALADVTAYHPEVDGPAVAAEVVLCNLSGMGFEGFICLGSLNREVHQVLSDDVRCDRTTYLKRRVRSDNLTSSEHDLAKTMIADWDGTYDDLVDTVRALHDSLLVCVQQ